ncbi:MAG: DNA mismatch endonuclease Vsr [Methylobacterium sp.]|nr:DNA mismatch endonuclease Vsr [Methylobacterium sp.]
MVDRLTPERRSWLMSRVARKNTTPELRVRRAAHALGLRFRLHRSDLPGKPDLVFPRRRLVVFVHGCFWHRHPGCRMATSPKSRTEFWLGKFAANQHRDASVTAELEKAGWRVVVIWECETRKPELLAAVMAERILGEGGEPTDRPALRRQ